MAIVNAMANTFKKELLQALHNFTLSTGDAFKIALYLTSATLGAGDTVYKTAGEVAAGGGYTTGGNTLVNVTPTLDTTTGICSFGNSTWSSSSITAGGAMIYNTRGGNNLCVVTLTFGGDKTSSAGDFVVQFPAVTAAAAIIRIA
jgi:hypothetical protein